MSPVALPDGKEVRDLLTDLLGRDVTVGAGSPIKVSLETPGMTAVFVDGSLKMRAVLTCDLGLAANASAALSLMPSHVAASAVAANELPENLAENCAEIANIFASLLNHPGGPHIRMYKTYIPGDRIPADVSGAAMLFGSRLDMTVDIAGYGKGSMSFVGV
jgi:hypothetical protein